MISGLVSCLVNHSNGAQWVGFLGRTERELDLRGNQYV
jgi:hypothetical protein